MEFITEGETVNCVRIYSDSKGDRRFIVTSFHADVDRVAPHVAASLTPEEINELEMWLTDRAKLQEAMETRPIEETIIEALPAVITQASQAMDKLGELDLGVYEAIRESVISLTRSLDRIERLTTDNEIELRQMPSSEALKERLGAIKENIEKKGK